MQKALSVLLMSQGLAAENSGICIRIKHTTQELVAECLFNIGAQPCPSPEEIIDRKLVGDSEKWDWVLPDNLLFAGYASRALALEEAHALCQSLKRNPKS